MAGRHKSKSGNPSDLAMVILILFVIGVVITYWKTILLVLFIIGTGVLIYALIKYVISTRTPQSLVNKSPDIYVNTQKPILTVYTALPTHQSPAENFNPSNQAVERKRVSVSPPKLPSMSREEVEAELNRLEAIVRR